MERPRRLVVRIEADPGWMGVTKTTPLSRTYSALLTVALDKAQPQAARETAMRLASQVIAARPPIARHHSKLHRRQLAPEIGPVVRVALEWRAYGV